MSCISYPALTTENPAHPVFADGLPASNVRPGSADAALSQRRPRLITVTGWMACWLIFCFQAVAPSSAQVFTKLGDFNGTNGIAPLGPMVQGADGNLYSVTLEGGANGEGSIFKVGLTGGLQTVYSFCPDQVSCEDGASPHALALGRDGNFYGAAAGGGANSDGTVYKITPEGVLTVLHDFTPSDGSFLGDLIAGRDGNFYGTAFSGGAHNGGTIFEVTATGRFRTLHDFCEQQNCSDGGNTVAPLVQGRDGNFYGTTPQGGPRQAGTIFKMTRAGVFSVLHNFCSKSRCADGGQPSIGLVRGRDGNLYGVTSQGGTGTCFRGCGTFFKITPAGALTTLHSFSADEGSVPNSLLQASDGNFYGTASNSQGSSTLITITPTGNVTTLYTLSASDGQLASSLMQANDGNFYGTALLGGINFNDGTVFGFSTGAGGADDNAGSDGRRVMSPGH